MVQFDKINLSYFIGFFILLYLTIRIFTVPISDDEYMTIEMHASQNILDILITGQQNLDWAANNHVLNTLFIKLELFVFGWQDWAIRLHILMSFVVGYFFCYKLLKIFITSEFRILLYMLLVFLNPYLLDFYGIARGYALSISAFIAALFYLFKYLETKSLKDFNALYFCMFISIWSNFSALYLLLILNLIIAYENRNFIKNLEQKKALLLGLVFSSLIVVIITFPLIKTLSSPIVYGGNSGIFNDMIVNYISQFIHHNPKIDRHLIFTKDWKLVEILGIILFLLWIALTLFSYTFKPMHKIKQSQNIFLFFLIAIATLSKILFFVNQTPFPTGRTQLLFSMAFYLGICVAFERIINTKPKFVSVLIFVVSLLITHFFYSLTFVNTIDWWQNGDAKDITQYLKMEIKRSNSNEIKTIGAENWQYHSLAFYVKGQLRNSLDIVWTDLSGDIIFDYLLAPKHRKSEVSDNYVSIHEFNKTILYKIKTKSSNHESMR